jgi:uncharacterized protein (DUF1330 family)
MVDDRINSVQKQEESPAYLLAIIDIEDASTYQRYMEEAAVTTKAAGAESLVVSETFLTLEGKKPASRIVIVKFPSMDALRAWYDSDQYQAARRIRANAASVTFLAAPGFIPKVD